MGKVDVGYGGEENRSARNCRASAQAGKGVGAQLILKKVNVLLNMSVAYAIFFDGYERQDY